MAIIVGHRGARNLWPENSLSGFRNVCRLGIESVEFDVHQSRDEELVVIHDPTLERTTFGLGPVGDLTAREICATRLRDTADECVPTLNAVLDVLQDSPLELHIEIKTDAVGRAYPGMERRLIDAVAGRGLAARSIITCFVPQILDKVRAEWPEGRVSASLDRRTAEMFGGIEPALDRFLAIASCLIAVEKGLLAATLPLCLNRVGSDRLGVWICNEAADLDHWLRQPVRRITTDRPDLALAARASHAALGRA
ncbi:MAG: glycerophosphodiester phosphodiesterase [Proteobacteria bacterium]|nr:glycerophosphodiester phosphodiesterase [Pseudomonadota bacterium]